MKQTFIEWAEGLLPWVLAHGLRILLIATGVFIINKFSKKLIVKVVRMAVVSDNYTSKESEVKREETLIRIFGWTVRILVIIMGGLMILEEVGVSIGPILAGAGVIGLAVGFGGQYLIRDVISGFFIILENQYRIGDIVDFGQVGGVVEDISLRMTTLRNLDGIVHYVPHGEIKTVSNLAKQYSRVNLNIGIGYSTDLDHAIKIVNKAGEELAEDPYFKNLIITTPQFLRVDEFADSAIIIKILGETQPLKQWEVTGELRKRLKKIFDKEGIEIPFPQRVVHSSAS